MSDQQPVQMTPEGSVRCCFCRTDEHGLPDVDEPISEQHWGIRFSPVFSPKSPIRVFGRHEGEMSKWRWKVSLDGVDVTNEMFEFEAGDNGWVALYHRSADDKRVVCKAANLHADEQHALAFIERGKVVAEKIPIPF